MSKNIFDIDKIKTISKWDKFRLLFKSPFYSYEDGCMLKCKSLNGNLYILKEEFYNPNNRS